MAVRASSLPYISQGVLKPVRFELSRDMQCLSRAKMIRPKFSIKRFPGRATVQSAFQLNMEAVIPTGRWVFEVEQPHLEEDFSMTYESASFKVDRSSNS
jgi:hypothetical protein